MNLPEVAVVAFCVALVATPLMIVLARRTGIVDRPGALKPQAAPVPYLGGVAVLAGVAVGAGAGRPEVLAPLGAATVLGVADDRWDLSAPLRLLGQLVVGTLVVVTCPVRFPGGLAAPLLIVLTVLLVNGVNLLDGLDMLAAGVVAVAALAFAVLLRHAGQDLAVALTASLAAFLLFNRPPARIYLGDGGSYLLGTSLAVLVAATWAPGVPLQRGLAGLALVAVPAAEVAFAIVRRVRARQPVLAGDRGHPYDRLVQRGWASPMVALAYAGTAAVLATAAVAAALRGSAAAVLAVDLAGAAVLIFGAAVTGALGPSQDALT